jgi:hypothetical protein
MRGVQLDRRLGDMLEDAVHAQAHPVIGFVGFEVDIRGAALDRVHQHLLTNLTTGVSSPLASTRGVVAEASSSPPPTRDCPGPRSRPARPPAHRRLPATGPGVRLMRSSSTRIGSTARLVWNLSSSSARYSVGSRCATNRRPPRLNSGSTWCLRSRSSLTRRSPTGWGRSSDSASTSGMPNSIELAAASCRGRGQPPWSRGTGRAACFSAGAASIALRARLRPWRRPAPSAGRCR